MSIKPVNNLNHKWQSHVYFQIFCNAYNKSNNKIKLNIKELWDQKKLRIFKEATAIVTGYASGIGIAICKELAKAGCEVVIADIQIDKANEVAENIKNSDGKAETKYVDVGKRIFWWIDRISPALSSKLGKGFYKTFAEM